ncbi:oligosaccharide flippase family protein, partial [Flavobacterium sp.]
GGLREALVQKKNATQKDYSTMFWLNIGISFLLYFFLFLIAPYIESFYKFENLSFYIRLQSLVLIIESIGLIQIVKAVKDLNLKKVTTARIPATIISFFVGIIMAYSGFGVLSLIVQQLVNEVVYLTLLVYNVRYKPEMVFSKASLKSLYGFGLKMFALSYINRIYAQSLNLIYANFYNVRELGLNVKSNGLQGVPIDIINSAFAKGLYPTMVRIQIHNKLLKKMFLLNVKKITFLMVFINFVFFFNALEIIRFLLGEKWINMVDYMQIASIGSLFLPINTQVISVFKVKKQPNLLLKIEMVWKIFALVMVLVLSVLTNFITVLWSIALLNGFMGLLYLYIGSKLLRFSFREESLKLMGLISYCFISGFILKKAIVYFLFEFHGLIKICCFSTLFLVMIIPFGYFVTDYKIKNLIKS